MVAVERQAVRTPRTVAQISVLLNVAWFRRLQLFHGVSRVFHELHLSQVRAQRVSCGSDCRNGSVASLLRCVSRLLSSVPKRLPLLLQMLQGRRFLEVPSCATAQVRPQAPRNIASILDPAKASRNSRRTAREKAFSNITGGDRDARCRPGPRRRPRAPCPSGRRRHGRAHGSGTSRHPADPRRSGRRSSVTA